MPVEVHVASEFSYNMPLLTERPFFIYISQSGETADSRAVLVQTNEMGHKALTITNVPVLRFLVKLIIHFRYTRDQKSQLHQRKLTQHSLQYFQF